MGRKRYKVQLVVLSNMDGDPPEGVEEKMIKDYLEGINGVGIIEVQEVQRLAAQTAPAPAPSEDEIRETVPSPPPDNMLSSVFKPEPATRSRKRKRN